MGSVDISKLDLKVLSKGKIRWANGIWQNARGIHESCPNREDKLRYIEECEKYIRSPENCKIEWNCETHKFGGNKYSYIFYFYSERINSVVKLAIDVQLENMAVVVGFMKISSQKESKRYVKHKAMSKTLDFDQIKTENINNPTALAREGGVKDD